MKLILLVTQMVEKALDVAEGWQEAGAPGVTIVRAHGLFGLQEALHDGQFELPRMLVSMGAALASVLESTDENVVMFLCACHDDQVDALIDRASAELGDLTEPGHGVLLVIPLDRTVGVRGKPATG